MVQQEEERARPLRTTALPPLNELRGDAIWFRDIKVLFANDRLTEILPSKSMTYEERINALVRFVTYTSALTYIYNQDPKYVIFGIIIITLLSLLYKQTAPAASDLKGYLDMRATNVAPVHRIPCQMSTPNNPFANFLLTDDLYRPQACPQTDPEQAKLIHDNFFDKFPRDARDVYGLDNSFRTFNTRPNSGFLSDQAAFAEFCYGGGGSKREHFLKQ